MLKTIFMGTPSFAAISLERLHRQAASPVAVVSQPAKPQGRGQKVTPTAVAQYASDQGIPLLVTSNCNEPSFVESLRKLEPDLILIVAFGQILKDEILKLPKLFCLNVHASLLPEYRGAAPIQRAILDGKKVTGITVQKIVPKLDAGDILLQRQLDISPTETSGELSDRLALLGAECLVESVQRVLSGNFHFTPQDESKVTYARKIDRQCAVIDWSKPCQMIFNQIRGLQPWPVAETRLEGKRLMIYRAEMGAQPETAKPGDVMTDGKTYLRVLCGDGVPLTLTEIQAENKKRLGIKQFLAAYRGHFSCRRMGDA